MVTVEQHQEHEQPHELGDREVLELRVHGVNNTPPAAVLDLPADQVAEVLGDDLAGFWRPKNPEGAPGTNELNDGSRGHVPDGITREAYSWGGLARRTPGGSISAGNKLLAVLITTGWTFLLPFGLANVAYWTRRLDTSSGPATKLDHRASAFLVRLFGLCLTAFLVVTVCEVSMDLVATQCYRPAVSGTGGAMVCTRLPGILAGLAKVDLSVRLVAFSAVPVAVLVGLWLLSSRSRSRYERAFPSEPDGDVPRPEGSDGPSEPKPILSRRDMWRGDVMVQGLAHLHLATGLALVVVSLALPVVVAKDPSCTAGFLRLTPQCRHQVATLHDAKPFMWVALVVAILLLVAIAGAAFVRASDSPDIHGDPNVPTAPFLLGAIVLVAYAALAMVIARPGIDDTARLAGVSALPTIVLIVMLALATGACLLRAGTWIAWIAVAVVDVALSLVAMAKVLALPVLVLLAVLIVIAVVGQRRVRLDSDDHAQKEAHEVAWAGAAPGVFLGAALLAQGILSAFVVLVVGDWLNGTNGASTLSPHVRAPSPAGQDVFLTVPVPYLLLGACGVLAVLVLLAGTGFAYLRSAKGLRAPLGRPEGFGGMLRHARQFARLAHRAEVLVGLLVVAGLLLVLGASITSAADLLHWRGAAGTQPPTLQRPLDLSTAAVAALGAAVLAALVKGAGSGARRPLGLVWDLVSFLPRAAHPFAPPCYAERAVPELTDRVAWWLDQPDLVIGGQRRGGSRVVISAHSLGGVLTVAALMRDPLVRFQETRAIRLLTYGSQLRAYFGRIFPELLGPSVLGTPPSGPASLSSPDPWAQQKAAPPPEWTIAPWSVVDRLSLGHETTLWRSLWRPTDYLGFPVCSFHGNIVDGPADEADESGYLLDVLTHSNYPRTLEYRQAMRDLATRD